MYRSCKRIYCVLFFVSLPPATLTAQTSGAWVFVADAGRYEIHGNRLGFSDAPTGVMLGISAGRQWGPVGFQLGLGTGIGDDAFTALEPGVELVFPRGTPIGLVAGVGAGVMWEGTLSLPYYAKLGVEAQFIEAIRLRATLRRGGHGNTGDAGAFRGPHAITLGVVWTK